ncbi:MAG: ribulose-phosphate 3-epimerase [Pelagibacterium sp. SCN 63-17]|nr:MAG: ribulose-phosphate 3-epimerase [Pelagibacterium sp. SCN 63-17]
MTTRPLRIAPSILSADFARLGEEVTAIISSGAVMKSVRPLTDAVFDVHLMIAPADPYLADFAKAGADIITVHAEAGPHLHRSLQAIRGLGKKAGVALNPATPVSAIQHVIDDCDLVLVMSVNPGFGGQSFIPESLNKIRQAKALIGNRDIDLEVDGGVTADNAREIVAAGANVLVAGSAIYAGNDPSTYASRIKAIRDAATGMVV